tara:strand:+ start:3608 stop:4906 length:1299 start_codon:yes stop_codon:yes gene_type:complete
MTIKFESYKNAGGGGTDNTRLLKTANLSDLTNVGTARTNLGLGTSATLDSGTANGNVVLLDATGLPAVDGSQLTGVTSTDNTRLLKTANLNDLDNVGTARTNLGLGTSATLDTGTANGNVVLLDATGLPAVDGSQLTGITSTDNTKLAIASNLSDLNNAGTARTNLGLGTSATLDSGTANGNVVVLDATGLPAVDGSQLTGITSTDNTKLAIASNLSDLNNAGTARTNLGLGTSATLDTGTANGNVVVLDATGLPAVDGSQLTGVTSTDNTRLLKTANLNDLDNVGTARTNLGLGTSAVLDVGTSANNIVQLDGSSKLPAVDGSQLTNLPSSGGFTYSSKASSDSPVTSAVDNHYSVNSSGGAVVINLPAIAGGNAGKEIRVKVKTAGNNISLTPNGTNTVEGGGAGAAYVLSVLNEAVTLVSDGTSNWEVI